MIDLQIARQVLEVETKTLESLSSRIDENFQKAAELIYACKGKVIVTGMGKSGHIGGKISATLSSTGTPSLFLHPAESSHGDLGVVAKNDVVLAISYGGGSNELNAMIDYVSRHGVTLVAMTGNLESGLAQAAHSVIDIGVSKEACPLGLAPTASTAATLALGDALAMTVMVARGLQKENFAEFHPGGSLGRKLLTRVRDVMHTGDALPLVKEGESMKTVIGHMTSKEVRGIAGVVDEKGQLMGVITDGDLRRCLDQDKDINSLQAKDLMSRTPKTIDANELAEKALFVMDQFNIQNLFAVEKDSVEDVHKPIGLLHLQDLLKANVR